MKKIKVRYRSFWFQISVPKLIHRTKDDREISYSYLISEVSGISKWISGYISIKIRERVCEGTITASLRRWTVAKTGQLANEQCFAQCSYGTEQQYMLYLQPINLWNICTMKSNFCTHWMWATIWTLTHL